MPLPFRYSVEEVNSFMEVVIPGLEEREFVQKYAPPSLSPPHAALRRGARSSPPSLLPS